MLLAQDRFRKCIGVIAVLVTLIQFYRTTGALRGSGGVPLSRLSYVIDRCIRTAFVFGFWSPLLLVLPAPVVLAGVAVYLPSYLDPAELRGGRPEIGVLTGIRTWPIWYWLKRRLNLRLVKTAPLPDSQYIFGLHPHGIMPWGAFFNVTTDINHFSDHFPGLDIRIAIVTIAFWVPIYRDLALWGKVMDCSRYAVRSAIEDGKSVMLVPGGAPEALQSVEGTHSLVLRRRRGFVRMALQTGLPLVPVYSFGENNQYHQLVPLDRRTRFGAAFHWLQEQVRYTVGVVLPVATNVLPKPCDVVTVFGRPIPVGPATENPSESQIDVLMNQYELGLRKLFEEYKAEYAADRTEEMRIE